MEATCQCGAMRAAIDAAAMPMVVACHCRACQRRSGSVLGVIAYFADALVMVTGEAGIFVRSCDSGRTIAQGFCGECGTTVWLRPEKHPTLIGIPVGLFADPGFAAPLRSVWEEARHGWLALPDGIPHFAQGPT